MIKATRALCVSLLFLAACAPKVQNRHFETPKTDFGPSLNDVDLSQRIHPSSRFQPELGWQGEVSSAEFFRQAENLIELGTLTESDSIRRLGVRWVQDFYATPDAVSRVPFAQSPYVEAAATQTRQDVSAALGDIRDELTHTRAILDAKLPAFTKKFTWSRERDLMKSLASAEIFLAQFRANLPAWGISDFMSAQIRQELDAQTKDLLSEAHGWIVKFYGADRFSRSLGVLTQVVQKYQLDLPADLQRTLQQGQQLGRELDSYRDEQGALTVLIDTWRLLDPPQRLKYFKPVNADLYDFLSGQNSKDLDCLRKPGCNGGFFKGIKKQLFILPKIKDYGLEKMRTILNQEALSYVLTTAETMARDQLPQLSAYLQSRIEKSLNENDDKIAGIQKNYASFLRDTLKPWAEKKLASSQGRIDGFESGRVKVSLDGHSPMRVQAQAGLTQVSAETTGAAFAALGAVYTQAAPPADFVLRSGISQMNKLLALGGYQEEKGQLVPAFFTPWRQPDRTLDLMSFTSSADSYAAPDLLILRSPFAAETSTAKNFSARALAEQIRGLSRLLEFTRDWTPSRYDETLGAIQAQDITAEYQADALKRPLFPKDIFFALNLGDVAVLLKNITKESSPVFLLNTDNKLIWANEYDFNGNDQAVMAGVVDIVNGRRSHRVRSEDVSRLILATSEFLQATEGVEKTRSSYVLEPDASGKAPLAALIEGRHDLRLLTLALANFISNSLRSPDGLVAPAYDLDGATLDSSSLRVRDQALAIRALLAARTATHLDIYLWAAQEIYFSMNRHLFNGDERFYQDSSGGALDFPDKLLSLRALTELRPYLPLSSQTQMQWVLQPWMKALSQLP